jgi:arylsulfatase
MNPRHLLPCLLILLPALARAAELPPNIVFILTDDQGYADIGCFGAKGFTTPNLDRMAAEGTRFTSFYVGQAVCTASRAALMTGCYPNRVGLQGALNHTSTIGLSDTEITLPQICKSRGYATAIFGKWHLGHLPPFSPLRHGFDEFFGTPYSNDNGKQHPVVHDMPPLPLIEQDKVIELEPDQDYFTQRITQHAVSFIQRNKDRPFFLYVPHIMPHVPIHASPAFHGRTPRGLYGDVIEELDWSVGQILSAIKDAGLDDRTLVIYTSDNGPFLSYGNHAGSADPLREGKLTAFEGGMREPCIMRWPGHIPANRTCDEIVSTLDMLPTVAKLIGAEVPKDRIIDGKDAWPLLSGAPGARTPHDVFYFYSGEELHAVRSGNWKLHLAHPYLVVNGPPGRDGKPANFANMKPHSIEESGIQGIASRHGYKVVHTDLALFDLATDPGELHDVSADHPDVVQRLQALAESARAELGDTLTNRKGANVRPPGRAQSP